MFWVNSSELLEAEIRSKTLNLMLRYWPMEHGLRCKIHPVIYRNSSRLVPTSSSYGTRMPTQTDNYLGSTATVLSKSTCSTLQKSTSSSSMSSKLQSFVYSTRTMYWLAGRLWKLRKCPKITSKRPWWNSATQKSKYFSRRFPNPSLEKTSLSSPIQSSHLIRSSRASFLKNLSRRRQLSPLTKKLSKPSRSSVSVHLLSKPMLSKSWKLKRPTNTNSFLTMSLGISQCLRLTHTWLKSKSRSLFKVITWSATKTTVLNWSIFPELIISID